jgi:S-adenosylmethionine:tRNA-ribosyltransferase-isomerase (queuine synthetase)
LQDRIKAIPLDAKQKQEVLSQAADLGNAKVPATLAGQNKHNVQKAYRESFISAYGSIMRLSAGLGFLGALMTVFFIRNKVVKKG